MAFTPSLTYKGRPLVRCGNDIYYGSMHDPYVVYLQVLTTKKEGNADVADKVHIVLLSTDESKPLPARIVRQANKAGGLFNALTFGDIMLRNQLKNEKSKQEPTMPGPFGPGCFCCTSSLCRRALLPDHAGAFTSLSITNFIMIYCLTVSERSSIVPYTSSTGLWQRLQPRCKLLSSPIIKKSPLRPE